MEFPDKTVFLPGNNSPRQIYFTEVSDSAEYHLNIFFTPKKRFLVVTKEIRMTPKPRHFKAKKIQFQGYLYLLNGREGHQLLT